MSLPEKISMVCAVLDELATAGMMSPHRDKVEALHLIREVLNDYQPPTTAPTRADGLLIAMRSKAANTGKDLNAQLYGIATLAEDALGLLHDEFAATC